MSLSKRRVLRQDEEGVASTVGTIMALLVILTFFSIFINQYIPAWGKEAEAAHMNLALGNFGNMKSAVDGQILSAQAALNSGSTYIPTETYTPIQLGTEQVPVFASPTIGRLSGDGDAASWSVSFEYVIPGNPPRQVNQVAAGNVHLQVDNRYHVPYTLAFEGGAILMSQSTGEAVRVDPRFAVLNTANGVEVGIVLVQLIGSGNVAGSGTEGVHTKLLAIDMQEYKDVSASLWVNHTTRFGTAWYNHLNTTLSLAFGVLESDFGDVSYNYTENPNGTGQEVTTPFYRLSRVESGQLHNLSLQIIHEPPEHRIFKIALYVAFVSIAVGRTSSTVEV